MDRLRRGYGTIDVPFSTAMVRLWHDTLDLKKGGKIQYDQKGNLSH